jgi:hypothetical protein
VKSLATIPKADNQNKTGRHDMGTSNIRIFHHPAHFSVTCHCNIPEYWETEEVEVDVNGRSAIFYGTSQESAADALADLERQLS